MNLGYKCHDNNSASSVHLGLQLENTTCMSLFSDINRVFISTTQCHSCSSNIVMMKSTSALQLGFRFRRLLFLFFLLWLGFHRLLLRIRILPVHVVSHWSNHCPATVRTLIASWLPWSKCLAVPFWLTTGHSSTAALLASHWWLLLWLFGWSMVLLMLSSAFLHCSSNWCMWSSCIWRTCSISWSNCCSLCCMKFSHFFKRLSLSPHKNRPAGLQKGSVAISPRRLSQWESNRGPNSPKIPLGPKGIMELSSAVVD